MKHVFYLCNNAFDSLGLEKILNFYNVIALENSDAVDTITNDGVNVIVAKDLSSPAIVQFVKNFSYNEEPFILSAHQPSSLKLSQLYGWNVVGKTSIANSSESFHDHVIKCSVYKKGDLKVFGNIHTVYVKDFSGYTIEILDWSTDYLESISDIVNSYHSFTDGYNTVECVLGEDKKLTVQNVYPESLPIGISSYTQAQIVDQKSPFVLYDIFDDVEKEDALNFTEQYVKQNPKSQDKIYELTQINIMVKYESVIINDLPSGIWKYGGDTTGKFDQECIAKYPIDEDGDKSLCLLHKGYSLYDITDKEGFIINTREKNKTLASGDLLASLKIPSSVINSYGDLHGWVYETIRGVLHYQMK